MSTQIKMNFITQYIKDLSFENPNAPANIVKFNKTPNNIGFNIDLNAKKLEEHNYEIELKITANANNKENPEEVFFIAEVIYAGIFNVEIGAEDDEELLQKILLIECPNILFPFVRRVMADVTRDGGFPPLFINPINFAELYHKNKENLKK